VKRLLSLVKTTATWIAALLILFEEWGWEPLARLVAQLGRLPFFAWLERVIARLPPYGALAVFAVPVLTLFPVKLLALYWLAAGHKMLGFGVIVAAKIVGTAIVARLYQLTQTQLMRLAWFAALHARWTAWKNRILAIVRASAAWQSITRARLRARRAWRWIRLRFRRATRTTTGE
jgi:hypothetical protein